MVPFSPLMYIIRPSFIHFVAGIFDILTHGFLIISNIIFYSFMTAIITDNISPFLSQLSAILVHTFPFVYFLSDMFITSSVILLIGGYIYMMWHAIGRIWNLNERRVIIVRGVPGIGKRTYVSWRELNDDYYGKYTECIWSKFFEKWNKETEVFEYDYDPIRIREADHALFARFINAVFRGVNRVYVAHTFERRWMYEPFVTLAKLRGYKVEIVELACNSKRELRHFNARSTRHVPYKKSLRVFCNWYHDIRAIIQEPYLEPEIGDQGDSIPLHISDENVCNWYREQLDRELDEYFANNGNINEHEPKQGSSNRRRKSTLTSGRLITPITSTDIWYARSRVDMTL